MSKYKNQGLGKIMGMLCIGLCINSIPSIAMEANDGREYRKTHIIQKEVRDPEERPAMGNKFPDPKKCQKYVDTMSPEQQESADKHLRTSSLSSLMGYYEQ